MPPIPPKDSTCSHGHLPLNLPRAAQASRACPATLPAVSYSSELARLWRSRPLCPRRSVSRRGGLLRNVRRLLCDLQGVAAPIPEERRHGRNNEDDPRPYLLCRSSGRLRRLAPRVVQIGALCSWSRKSSCKLEWYQAAVIAPESRSSKIWIMVSSALGSRHSSSQHPEFVGSRR